MPRPTSGMPSPVYTPNQALHCSGHAQPSTEAQLLRLSKRNGVRILGGLTERQARRRIAQLREIENA